VLRLAVPRMREAMRSGKKGSSASTFSPTPVNLMGAPDIVRTYVYTCVCVCVCCVCACACVCVCVCVLQHKHTHTHTHTRTRTHAQTHTNAHTHKDTHTHTQLTKPQALALTKPLCYAPTGRLHLVYHHPALSG